MKDDEILWTASDMRSYLRVSVRTWYRIKRLFPRVPGLPLTRYDPQVVKAIVAGKQAPAHQHRDVRAAAKRNREPNE